MLSLEHVSKTFPGQNALVDVDFAVGNGEIHALVGQNGSGKSTLIKVLAGSHQPDYGATAEMADRRLELGSARASRQAGIRFIHQDLALVDELDAVDNLALGDRYQGRAWLRSGVEGQAARRLLEEFDLDFDVAAPVGRLSPAQRTMLAITRAMRDGVEACRLLVLDEPTASLPAAEVAHLYALLRRVRDRGSSVLYVTHRLEEVFDLADQVTVLRDGRRIVTRPVAGMSEEDLVALIVGRRVGSLYPQIPAPRAKVVLRVKDLVGATVRGVTLELRAGEILGIAGLLGSGREELPYLLFGAKPWTSGCLEFNGRTYRRMTPAEAIRAGMGFVPAERKREAALVPLTVRENVTLPRLTSRAVSKWLNKRRERLDVLPWVERVQITPPDPERTMGLLSGGNQQKAILARWLRCAPAVLIVSEPTQGVDVGAKAAIYTILAELASLGAAVIVSSSDTSELAAIAGRVLVMGNGEAISELAPTEVTPHRLDELLLRVKTSRKEAAL